MYYIGIDLGTSAVKLLLVDDEGHILNTVSGEYPLEFPHPGWSQQNPEDWKYAVLTGIPRLLEGFDRSRVAGIGCGGQMHGLVVLDSDDRVIRPAILWNDGRTAKQVYYLNETVGKKTLSGLTANIAFAGFTAPKLLWLCENEPENFARIAKIMLPKDYINYVLTGVHCCDYSDASGMLLLDVEHKCWSKEMLDICGVSEAQIPQLFESWQPVGALTESMSVLLGLDPAVKVVAGAGDNAAEQAPITGEKLGHNHVYFLPYLMGERSPINDTNARGAFVGMTMDTARADLVQAVLEGVAFAIRDSVEVARSLGVDIPVSKVCGGGSRSDLWCRIIANVLGIPLQRLKTEQGPGYGGAMLAMVGCGRFDSVQAAADALVEVAGEIQPEPELTALYEERYRYYRVKYEVA